MQNQYEFLSEKIMGIPKALLYHCSHEDGKVPCVIAENFYLDEEGNLFLSIPNESCYHFFQEDKFAARMFLYKKGFTYSLNLSGCGQIVKMGESNKFNYYGFDPDKLIVKIKVGRIEYNDLTIKSWEEQIDQFIEKVLTKISGYLSNLFFPEKKSLKTWP